MLLPTLCSERDGILVAAYIHIAQRLRSVCGGCEVDPAKVETRLWC